uniref:Amino acid transporter transmembrane domain-containing protein n=1 Tax=Corethron hystrix TaxID=216773 RepID=A0A7S1BV12_9STRA
MPLVWIRDIRRLAPTNFAATCLTAAGLAGCLALAAAQNDTDEIQNVQDLRAFGKQWYLFLGTSFFIFEGSVTLLLPLQEAVETAPDRAAFPALNRKVMLSIVSFYSLFALVC